MATKTKKWRDQRGEDAVWVKLAVPVTGKLRDGLVAVARRAGVTRAEDLSSGAETRLGLAAGKESRRPGLDRAAPLSGLPSGQEVAPQDLGRGEILTSAFLCARWSASRTAEHSDAAFAQGDRGNGRRQVFW